MTLNKHTYTIKTFTTFILTILIILPSHALVYSQFVNLITKNHFSDDSFKVFINNQQNHSSIPDLYDSSRDFKVYSNGETFTNITYVLQDVLIHQITIETLTTIEDDVNLILTNKEGKEWKFEMSYSCENEMWLTNSIYHHCIEKGLLLRKLDQRTLTFPVSESYSVHEGSIKWWQQFTKLEILFRRGLYDQITILEIVVLGKSQFSEQDCNCFKPGLQDVAQACGSDRACLCKPGVTSKDCSPNCGKEMTIYPPYGPKAQLIHLFNAACLSSFPGYSIVVGHSKCQQKNDSLPHVFGNGTIIRGASSACILVKDLPIRRQHQVKACWEEDHIFCIFLDSQKYHQRHAPTIHTFTNHSIQSGGTAVEVTGTDLDSSPNILLDVYFITASTVTLLSSANLTEPRLRVCRPNTNGTLLICHTPNMNYKEIQPHISMKTNMTIRTNPGVKFPLILCKDPIFHQLESNKQQKNEIGYFKIFGSNFLPVCLKESDFSLIVGETNIEDFSMGNNFILYKPPTQVKPSMSDQNGASKIQVSVGNIHRIVGYIYFNGKHIPTFAIVLIAVAGLVVLVLLLLLVFLIAKRKACFQVQKEIKETENNDLIGRLDEPLKSQVIRCLADEKDLEMKDKIGQGHFGMVFMGSLNGREVAVKTLKTSTSHSFKSKVEFLSEAVRMMDLCHQNVLILQAIVIRHQQQPMIVLPYMQNGDLKSYVEKDENEFILGELLEICLQVAAGMHYLASKNIIHRDLAARNCMVDDEKIVKVADFGLARDLYKKDYYISSPNTPLPFKWMALEVLDGKNKFSEKTDMWSFGVLCWEVLTEGSSPYFGMKNADVKPYLKGGQRLDKPDTVPDYVYSLLLSCWLEDPSLRPNFGEIKRSIEEVFAMQISTHKLSVKTSSSVPIPSDYSAQLP